MATILSITDEGGAMCTGDVAGDAASVVANPTVTATATASTDLLDCDTTNDPTGAGTVTIETSVAGTYEIEYTVAGGPVATATITTSGSPASSTINIFSPGDVVITSISDEFGCAGTIGSPNTQTVDLPAGTTASATAPTDPYCNDGTVIVDLTSDVTINGTPAGGTTTFYIANPAGLSTLALSAIEVMTPTAFTIPNGSTGETLFFIYTAPDGCEVIDSFTLLADPSQCIFDLALIKTFVSSNDLVLPAGISPGDEVTFAITVFNQGLIDATDIEVTDYFPTPDLAWTSTDAAGTTTTNSAGNAVVITDNSNGVYTIDALEAGDDVTVEMTFTIDANFTGTSIVNDAEITSADNDGDDSTPPPTDIDSTPGDNSTTDSELDTGIDNNPEDSNNPGDTDNSDNPENNDDFDPELLSIIQPCPSPSFTCTANIDPCNDTTVALSALDLGTQGTAVTDGTWSGTGSFFINDQGTPAVADDVLEFDGNSPERTYTLELTMVNNGCVVTSAVCTFTVAKTCAANGGGF